MTKSKLAPYGWNTYWGRHSGRTGIGSQRVERVCEECGQAFKAWRHRADKARFCGYACYWAYDQHPERKAAAFWERVEKTDGCWWWRGTILNTGYGVFRVGGKPFGAHRYAWQLISGPIPAGLVVCHRCDHPACVRPDHLWLGTVKDNAQDMSAKGRGRQSKKAAH